MCLSQGNLENIMLRHKFYVVVERSRRASESEDVRVFKLRLLESRFLRNLGDPCSLCLARLYTNIPITAKNIPKQLRGVTGFLKIKSDNAITAIRLVAFETCKEKVVSYKVKLRVL